MGAIQRAVGLGIIGILAPSGSGCGTIHDVTYTPFTPIARSQEAPKTTPVAKEKPPAWLVEGSQPLPTSSPIRAELTAIAHSAQDSPVTIVPHVEVERSAAMLPVVEVAPPVQPIRLHTTAEPDWRPASEFRSR
jgi:hypothetical protein